MPQPSAPGQISFFESQQVLFLTGLLQAQDFYLLGSPLAASYSPIMHTTAFQTLGLPHKYHLAENTRVDAYADILNSPSFGGASVTLPHKLTIMPFLQRVSSHAHAIGAVNTIISTPNGLIGDNTDWRAIRASVQKALSPAHAVSADTTALVYGAGGAARAAVYALFQIGVLSVYLWNRTRDRADRLIADLSRLSPALRIMRLSSGDVVELAHLPSPPQVIISTLPEMTDVDHSLVPIPSNLLAADGGVALDLNFASDDSPVLSLARKTPGWVGVPALEVLLEQGYEQLRAWTARRAPRKAMRLATLEERERRRRAKEGPEIVVR
jgi:pentafunctional AROM polypeptide